MFERSYAIYSIDWTDREEMDADINLAVGLYDHPRAAASIACMSNDRDQLHVLIEYWRESDGDRQQGAEGSLDGGAAPRQPRRARSSRSHDARAAASDQSKSLDQSVEPAGGGARRPREEDIPLPFDGAVLPDTLIDWP